MRQNSRTTRSVLRWYVDLRFIGEDYAVPSAESIAAIRELAQAETITGDTGNLLETPEVVGNVAGQP
jgi:hypothetical protein